MKVLTVKDLLKILQKAYNEGRGDDMVLIPNDDYDLDGDYRTIGTVDIYNYREGCLYLETNDIEEEQEFWDEWYKEHGAE